MCITYVFFKTYENPYFEQLELSCLKFFGRDFMLTYDFLETVRKDFRIVKYLFLGLRTVIFQSYISMFCSDNFCSVNSSLSFLEQIHGLSSPLNFGLIVLINAPLLFFVRPESEHFTQCRLQIVSINLASRNSFMGEVLSCSFRVQTSLLVAVCAKLWPFS